MSRMTFVVEFPDCKEPPIRAGTYILGGKLLSVEFESEARPGDLLIAARMMLSQGKKWFDILCSLSGTHGWGLTTPESHMHTLTVPSWQLDDASEMVSEIVPAIYHVEVRSDDWHEIDCKGGAKS